MHGSIFRAHGCSDEGHGPAICMLSNKYLARCSLAGYPEGFLARGWGRWLSAVGVRARFGYTCTKGFLRWVLHYHIGGES
jgi:hypothetical protein